MNKEQHWLRAVIHSSPVMEPDLRSRRATHPKQPEQLMKHSISRHCAIEQLCWPDGSPFAKGTPFPKWVKPGHITRMQKLVLQEYQRYRKGVKSKLVSVQPAGDAERIVVRLKLYGIRDVGAFIRNGSICTIFPEDNV